MEAGDEVTVSLVEPGGDLTQAPPYATVLVDDFGQFNVQLLGRTIRSGSIIRN